MNIFFLLNRVKYFKKLRYLQKGAAAVELSFIIIPLIILIFAIFEFGIVFNNWIALTHAAREGARLAAVAEDENVIEEAIINRAPTVRIDSININGLYNKIGMPVTVTVTGEVINFDLPLVASKAIMLTSSATLRIEREP